MTLDWKNPHLRDFLYQKDIGVFYCASHNASLISPEHHFLTMHRGTHLKAPMRKEIRQMIDQLSPPVKLRLPNKPIAPLSWLPSPRKGVECKICFSVFASEESAKNHIWANHKSHITPDVGVTDLIQTGCYFQTSGKHAQAFRVNPTFSDLPGSVFPKFMEDLDEKWKSGQLMKEAAQSSGTSKEYDVSGFLAAAGWVGAIEGYSLQDLRRKVALPLMTQEPHLCHIKGFGKRFLSQIQDLNDVHPVLPQELTSWRKSP
jgi:hypothetical protein